MALSSTTFACPKGTTLSGGTGPNHKGGTCIPIDKNSQQQKPSSNSKSNNPVATKAVNTQKTVPNSSQEKTIKVEKGKTEIKSKQTEPKKN
ncbi:hypothetical protein B9T31_12950 [Acinetobacter sp. ANC 4558]|nr:hypothetical protein B9T31_12950 [Acinetobacter sp. ANC 4558]